ncbi:MAG: hypothetical protein JST69_10010 [Bacteroidetes bacterium]|nr:hypothetical protein [Bacteroidota bacterium]
MIRMIQSYKPLWWLCSAVVVFWLINFAILYKLPAAERGTYGDMFGVMNSLFTGLAFAGLLYSNFLQQKQIDQIERENKDRGVTERNNETLKQCQYYLSVMQTHFKELHIDTAQGLLPRFLELEEINHETLKSKAGYYDTVVKGLNPDLLLLLGKLEGFAAIVLFGNINFDLAKKVIGKNYCIWVNNLSGYIAFYRKDDDIRFCEHTLNLWKKWK